MDATLNSLKKFNKGSLEEILFKTSKNVIII